LPGRDIVFVGDSTFAVHELTHALDSRATFISRLRLDANLFAPPPERHARAVGRPAQKGTIAQAEDSALRPSYAMAHNNRVLLVWLQAREEARDHLGHRTVV
jgi:hypothetical protein